MCDVYDTAKERATVRWVRTSERPVADLTKYGATPREIAKAILLQAFNEGLDLTLIVENTSMKCEMFPALQAVFNDYYSGQYGRRYAFV